MTATDALIATGYTPHGLIRRLPLINAARTLPRSVRQRPCFRLLSVAVHSAHAVVNAELRGDGPFRGVSFTFRQPHTALAQERFWQTTLPKVLNRHAQTEGVPVTLPGEAHDLFIWHDRQYR